MSDADHYDYEEFVEAPDDGTKAGGCWLMLLVFAVGCAVYLWWL